MARKKKARAERAPRMKASSRLVTETTDSASSEVTETTVKPERIRSADPPSGVGGSTDSMGTREPDTLPVAAHDVAGSATHVSDSVAGGRGGRALRPTCFRSLLLLNCVQTRAKLDTKPLRLCAHLRGEISVTRSDHTVRSSDSLTLRIVEQFRRLGGRQESRRGG